MSTPTRTNPWLLVYDELADMVRSRREVQDLVKSGNFVVFDSIDPLRRDIQPADLPELVLVSAGVGDANLHDTSSTTRCVRSYQWLISTGDMRLGKLLYPVEWAIFCAMVDWRSRLTRLVWPLNSDWHFVKAARLSSASEGQSDPERNRGIRGWSAIWSCEVEMHFETRTLARN